MDDTRPGRRVAIVAGLRTPFAKSGTVFRDVTAVALARHAARELLYRSELDGREVDEVIFGQVVPSVLAPNVAREVSLLPQLPPSVPAYTLNRACASAAQAITNAADQIALGHADVVLAGGVESLSDIPILHSRRFSQILVEASKAKSLGGRLAVCGPMRPRDLVPVTPAIAEPSTGETMGQSAEKMAKENGISREDQDRIALHEPSAGEPRPPPTAGSPRRSRPGSAARTWTRSSRADNGIRADTSLEALAKLKPVFDRRYGSVTAGNSSPLTDGAAAVLLMAEEKAAGAGLRAARVHPELRGRGGGSRLAAAHGPGVRGAQGARARRTQLEAISAWSRSTRPSPPRCSPTCRPGARQAWAERLGLSGPVGEVDWERTNVIGRLHRHRAPVRRHRRPARHHARQRDAPARRAVRADLDLRAGRDGLRDGPGAEVVASHRPQRQSPEAALRTRGASGPGTED